ncbi:hypothetical protein ACOME3_007129 [Neoechinorhynchus agilis]
MRRNVPNDTTIGDVLREMEEVVYEQNLKLHLDIAANKAKVVQNCPDKSGQSTLDEIMNQKDKAAILDLWETSILMKECNELVKHGDQLNNCTNIADFGERIALMKMHHARIRDQMDQLDPIRFKNAVSAALASQYHHLLRFEPPVRRPKPWSDLTEAEWKVDLRKRRQTNAERNLNRLAPDQFKKVVSNIMVGNFDQIITGPKSSFIPSDYDPYDRIRNVEKKLAFIRKQREDIRAQLKRLEPKTRSQESLKNEIQDLDNSLVLPSKGCFHLQSAMSHAWKSVASLKISWPAVRRRIENLIPNRYPETSSMRNFTFASARERFNRFYALKEPPKFLEGRPMIRPPPPPPRSRAKSAHIRKMDYKY